MWLVRLFLWSLVASLCLQGYQNADKYMSLLGGMGLTLAIMKEQFSFEKKEIPRAFVVAAIKETVKHPMILQVPHVQRRLTEIEKSLTHLRSHEITWHLKFNDVISELELEEPWAPAVRRSNKALSTLNRAIVNKTVSCMWYPTSKCKYWTTTVRTLNKTYQETLYDPWISLMRYKPVQARRLNATLVGFYEHFKTLYNLTYRDPRVAELLGQINSVEPLIVRTLLQGDLWTSCISHVVQQDYRVRDVLDKAGLTEVRQIHARIYNLSVSHIDPKIVETWFDEAAIFSWWLPDTIPAIVRRCATHTTGDCVRIGSIEIDSLQSRLSESISRSVLIGLWNGLPMVLVIFVLELIISYLPLSKPPLRSPPPSTLTLT
jgi:hypothetical protein